MIGAAAIAVHGVSRATRDIDLFTLSQECLETSFWTSLRTTARIEAHVRKGEPRILSPVSSGSPRRARIRSMSSSARAPGNGP